MIYRSSSLLSKNDNASYSIAEMARTPETYLECLLQLNEEFQEAENEYNIAYYRALKESALNESTDIVLSESLISKAAEVLSKMIEAIINFFRKIIAKIRGGEAKKKAENAKIVYEKLENDPKFKEERKVFTCYHYAEWKMINDTEVLQYLQSTEDWIRRLCNGNSVADPTEEHLAGTYKFITSLCKKAAHNNYVERKAVKVINDQTFREFIQANITYRESKEMTGNEWLQLHSHVIQEAKTYDKDIGKAIDKRFEELKSLFKQSATGLTPENFTKAKGYINQFKSVIESWGWFLSANYLVFEAAIRAITDYDSTEAAQHESSTIHGELFNSDTLFANKDPRDFNRTEWMDLELTAEAYCFNQAINEARRSMAIQEAIIWSENAIPSDTFRKLQAMQEIEMNKLGDAISDIIARIREFINKFISEIQDKHGPNSKFFIKYKNLIESNPVKIANKSPAKSTGDILIGLKRILYESKPMNFNPATMTQTDKIEMFEKNFVNGFDTTGGKRSIKWSRDNGMTITDFCKVYYGASMPVDKYPLVEYSNEDLTNAMKDIIRFMTNPHQTIFAQIKKDLSDLEREAKKAGAKVARPNATVNNTNRDNTDQQSNVNSNTNNGDKGGEQSVNASTEFYSVLYDRWFTEMDISNPKETSGENKDNEQDSKPKGPNPAKIYVDVIKDILLAKLTAARFIYSECNQLIRAHAKSYMSKEQAAAEAKAEKGNAQNNQQNQQQAQGQQANG